MYINICERVIDQKFQWTHQDTIEAPFQRYNNLDADFERK